MTNKKIAIAANQFHATCTCSCLPFADGIAPTIPDVMKKAKRVVTLSPLSPSLGSSLALCIDVFWIAYLAHVLLNETSIFPMAAEIVRSTLSAE